MSILLKDYDLEAAKERMRSHIDFERRVCTDFGWTQAIRDCKDRWLEGRHRGLVRPLQALIRTPAVAAIDGDLSDHPPPQSRRADTLGEAEFSGTTTNVLATARAYRAAGYTVVGDDVRPDEPLHVVVLVGDAFTTTLLASDRPSD